MKKIKLITLIVFSFIFFSGFLTSDTDMYYRISKSLDIFGKVYKEVAINYVEEINPEEFMLAGIKSMLGQLDPYSVYVDSKDQKDLDIVTTGKYNGVGLSVGLEDNKVIVLDLLEGYSAQRQGMRLGDVIKKINDVELTKDNYDYFDIIQKGDKGASFTFTVKREGIEELLKFVLVKEEIEIANVPFYEFIPASSNNAYIKLSGFSRTAGEEIKNALIELGKRKKIESIILDLRGNPGGLLEAAIEVSQKFLKKGDKIVSVIGRDTTNKKEFFAKEEPLAGDIPLAVLVDDGTASAAEIVSGAIQDHDRGLIIGENTFGKGLVQSIIPLSGNTSLKMTSAKYYTPSGRCIQKVNYSEKNPVFEKQQTNTSSSFFTANKRKVYSAGGILPDSVVLQRKLSPLSSRLLAEGFFFKFATTYFNQNPKIEIANIDNEHLYSDFINYVKTQNFEFTSKSEKMIEQLKKTLKEEGYNSKANEELDKVVSEVNSSKNADFIKYKNDIILLVRDELIERIAGRKGRLKELLNYDIQFEKAFKLVSDRKAYNHILNK